MDRPFESAVAEHRATVLRVCRAVLGPHEDAEDAWQETFLAALKAWPSIPEDANVQAWLVTIAHRKSVDVLRARQRRPVPTGALPEVAVEDPPIAEHQALWAAVADLPRKQRLAVAYHYLAGLPHRDVAELIGGTPDAARRAASDGIKRLRADDDTC